MGHCANVLLRTLYYLLSQQHFQNIPKILVETLYLSLHLTSQEHYLK